VELRDRLRRFRQDASPGEEQEERSLPRLDTVQASAMNTPLPKVRLTRRERKKRRVGFKGILVVLGVSVVVMLMGSGMVCERYRDGLEGACEVVDKGYRVLVDNDVIVRAKEYVVSLSIPTRLEQAVVHFKTHTIPLFRTVLIRGVDDIQTFLLERKNAVSKKSSVRRLNPAVLDTLVGSARDDVDGVWASTLSFLEDVWEMKKIASSNKANVVLFVCTSTKACQSTEDELAATLDPSSVLKLLKETDKGDVQRRLGEFLKREPNSVVVIPHIEHWSPVLISVLNNALGEGGSLVVDGESIPTSGATYFITTLIPKSIVDSQNSPPNLSTAVKNHLIKLLSSHSPNGDGIVSTDEMVSAVLNSFRRRIDVVASVL